MKRGAAACEFSSPLYRVLLTNAIRVLSGDHEGTFIVPCPP
jgi:hypothetical protein